MNTSAFDPAAFLDAQIIDANEKRPLLPTENPEHESGLYDAVIGELTTKSGTISQGARIGQPWLSMVVPLRLQLGAQLQSEGLPAQLQLTDMAFLDLTPTGQMDNGKGKNRQQRAYREATGQNVAGQPWAWRMLTGRVVKVKIMHEVYNGAIVEKIAQIFPA